MSRKKRTTHGVYVTRTINPTRDRMYQQSTDFEIGAILDRAESEAEEVRGRDNKHARNDAASAAEFAGRVRRLLDRLPKIAPQHESYIRNTLAAAFHVGLLCERMLMRFHDPMVVRGRNNKRQNVDGANNANKVARERRDTGIAAFNEKVSRGMKRSAAYFETSEEFEVDERTVRRWVQQKKKIRGQR